MRSTISKHSVAGAAVAGVLMLAGHGPVRAQVVARAGVARAGVARTSVHASNVNVVRNVNVYGGGVRYDRWGHPLAAAAAVTATALAIGTVVSALPPQCSTLVVGAATYHNCGGVYYQPVYQGNSVQYIVVNAPQ